MSARMLPKECFDVSDRCGHAVGRKALQKCLTIALAGNARIEEDKDSAIMQRADEPAEALFEGEHGFRDLVVKEGTAAGLFNRFHARLDNWIAWDSERETVDDDATECLALYINS